MLNKLAHGPSLLDLPFNALVRLGDIMKILAQQYLDLGERLKEAVGVFDANETVASLDETSPEPLTAPEREALRETLRNLRNVCAEIPLSTSYELLRSSINDLPQTRRELLILIRAVKSEIQGVLFLRVPPHRATYYDHTGLLTPAARTAFPTIVKELRSAGNCYALDLPTACVFHCMRGLETALRLLAADVQLTWTKEQWHTIIEQIESAIEKQRRTLPSGVAKDERLAFLSQAAKEFFYFKDGWRNYVSHNKVTYEEADAIRALNHVEAFVDLLATKLSEAP